MSISITWEFWHMFFSFGIIDANMQDFIYKWPNQKRSTTTKIGPRFFFWKKKKKKEWWISISFFYFRKISIVKFISGLMESKWTYLTCFSFCSIYVVCSAQVSSRKFIHLLTTSASTLHEEIDLESSSSCRPRNFGGKGLRF